MTTPAHDRARETILQITHQLRDERTDGSYPTQHDIEIALAMRINQLEDSVSVLRSEIQRKSVTRP